MNSPNNTTGHPKDLAQLLRLRQVQVDKAEEHLRVRRAECDRASDSLLASTRALADDQARFGEFSAYMVGEGASELARSGLWIGNYRQRLDIAVVRSQNALTRDRNLLDKSTADLTLAHQAWLREVARRDGVELALRRSRAAELRESERKAEEELDDLTRRGAVSPGPVPRGLTDIARH